MAIVLNDNPGTYYSVHGDLLFVAYEATKATDPVTYPGYKYVCDIYIGGTLIQRCKVHPHPTHKRGVFNIASVVRNYVIASFNPELSGIFCQALGSGEFFIEVQCKFGEEYSGTTTINLTVDSARTYYNHYNGRIRGGDETILDSYIGVPTTNRPRTAQIFYDDLYYFVPYAISGTSITVTVTAYSAAGVSLSTDNDTETVVANECNILNLSPTAINDYFGAGTIPTNTAYYIVDLDGEELRFDVICEPMHEPFTIHWLNQLGGFESFSFHKKSSRSFEVEKKDFTKLPYTINESTGTVNYANGGNVVNETKTVFATKFREKLKLSTDFLTDAEWEWLQELIISPNVFITEGTNLIPVVLMSNSYEQKKFINDKLQPLTIEIEFGGNQNAQFR